MLADSRLTDPDWAVRQAAVIELAPRASEASVREALELRLDDADSAVSMVAAAVLVLNGDGLRRVLAELGVCDSATFEWIFDAVTECCWFEPAIYEQLLLIAAEQPETDMSGYAADIVEYLRFDPRVPGDRFVGRPLDILSLVRGVETVVTAL